MSVKNGDKSRFHRERKQKIARRQRTQALLSRATMQKKAAGSLPHAKSPSVQA